MILRVMSSSYLQCGKFSWARFGEFGHVHFHFFSIIVANVWWWRDHSKYNLATPNKFSEIFPVGLIGERARFCREFHLQWKMHVLSVAFFISVWPNIDPVITCRIRHDEVKHIVAHVSINNRRHHLLPLIWMSVWTRCACMGVHACFLHFVYFTCIFACQ